jgi:hypothetical protein
MNHPESYKPVPPAPGERKIHIVFDYVIQKVPTRTDRKVIYSRQDFNIFLNIQPKSLDERGYPDPRAMWFAERMFLKAFNNKHLPDVRLMEWKAHLKDDPFILSEYRVLLSPAAD